MHAPGTAESPAPPSDRNFDSRYGTDTAGEIPVEHLGLGARGAAEAVSYEPTDPAAFRHMVACLPIHHRDYAFVDLGAGKGRAVLLATLVPFGSVIGVELSPVLHRAAAENLRAWGRAGGDGRRVRLLLQDAAAYTPPPDPCVVYMFNPFREGLMARVLHNLRSSVARSPRDLWIVYYNPQLQELFRQQRWLRRTHFEQGYQQGDFGIWRATADAADQDSVGQS